MATTTFRLRPSTKDKSASIQLTFQYGKGKRLRYSTGLIVSNAKNWDLNKMRIKNVVEEKYKTDINNQLNKLNTQLEEWYVELSVNQKSKITNDLIKEFCNQFFNRTSLKEEETKPKEFLEYYEWHITNYSQKPLPTSGKPLGKGTIKTYSNSYNIIKRFNDDMYPLYFKNITLSFYDDFIEWLQYQDYSANYIGTQIKVLKTILQSATERDYNTNSDYTKRYFRKPVDYIDNIFLSLKEIDSISQLDFSEFKVIKENKTLKITKDMMSKARDLFLIGCSTGLRVSDYNRLKQENIYSDENGRTYFKLITQKNRKPITIPINTTAQKILNKNNGNPPVRLPQQHINYCLKIMGNMAGINELTSKTMIKGGKTKTIKMPKHDFITNHTARRSFCTNAYLSGMPTADIMAISGHATEKVFYNYIKVNDLQKAVKIGKHKFFL